MDEILFRILSLAACAGFILGILSGWLPHLLVALALTGTLVWLNRKRG